MEELEMIEELAPAEPHWSIPYEINGQIYLYVIGDASILHDEVPEVAPDSSILLSPAEFDEEGVETTPEVKRQKSALEYITGELDHLKAMESIHTFGDGAIGFAAFKADGPRYRKKRFNAKDADDWKQFAEAVWGDRAEIVTREVYHAKIDEDEVVETDSITF